MELNDYPLETEEAHVGLLAKLLGTLDDLLLKICPEGFACSPYFFLYHHNLDFEYRCYRLHRARMYKQARRRGTEHVVAPLMDLKKWYDSEYKPMRCVLPDEPVAMLLDVFFQLQSTGVFYNRNSEAVYRFEKEEIRIDQTVSPAIKACGLEVSALFSLSSFLNCSARKLNKVDLTHVKRHILEFLRTEGIAFRYRCPYLQFMRKWGREAEDLSDEDGIRCADIASFLELPQLDFSEAFVEVSEEEPSEFLKLYHEVYEEWPDGWPLRVEDYL